MARFEMDLPDDVIKEIESVYFDSDKIFGGMTKAGAKVVESQVRANVPSGFRGSNIMRCLKVTKTYKTPTDGGINTKVGFYGYFENKNKKLTPAPLVCNVFEYGSTKFPKKPFFRRSFSKSAITAAMLAEQKKLSGGLLDE